jgi:hypothetical protein
MILEKAQASRCTETGIQFAYSEVMVQMGYLSEQKFYVLTCRSRFCSNRQRPGWIFRTRVSDRAAVEGTPKPELSSSVLDIRQLKKIARSIGAQGKIVRINRERFMLVGRMLRPVFADCSA